MSGEIYISVKTADADAPDSSKIVIYAKEDGLYIRRPNDNVGMRLRLGADDTMSSQLLNNSGETLQYGEVVIWDVTEDEAVVKTNVLGDYRVAGVVNATEIENGATGSVMTVAGQIVEVLCDSTAVSRGQFLMASSTAGRATPAGYIRTENTFAVALSEKASGSGGLVSAMIVHSTRTVTAGSGGWELGGYTTSGITNGQKMIFANETWQTVVSAALPIALYNNAGLSYGVVAGYSIGGWEGTNNYANAYKLVIATEVTSAATSANLGTARRSLRYGHNAAEKGWVVGGWTTAASNLTDKITYATDTRSAGSNLSVADQFRAGIGDGTQIFTAGATTPTNRIVVATEVISAYTESNITTSAYYAVMSYLSTAGFYVQGTTTVKITFATGLPASSTNTNSSHNSAAGLTDGLTVGYVAGHSSAPLDVVERFNPATETYAISTYPMQVGKIGGAVFSVGAF